MRIDKVLRDESSGISVPEWELGPIETEIAGASLTWRVLKRTLRGGRQEGVESIEVDNGIFQFTIVPTRGFAIWTASAGNVRLGWDSPVDEIVHPRFIDLTDDGGFGWLKGFGAWIDRCGLESIGPPCTDNGRDLTLHGRLSYIPAGFVELNFESEPVPRLVVRGIVEESIPSGGTLQLVTEVSTELGSAKLILADKITNRADSPQEWQALYHINFGPPLLGKGSEFIASVEKLIPRDARSEEGDPAKWNYYEGPHGEGYTEQVFLLELGANAEGTTKVMLENPEKSEAVTLSFNKSSFPHFVLWKNEVPANAGYVTGLEPSTSYPYERTTERAEGRVPVLGPGESRHLEIAIQVLTSADSIAAEEEAILKIGRT